MKKKFTFLATFIIPLFVFSQNYNEQTNMELEESNPNYCVVMDNATAMFVKCNMHGNVLQKFESINKKMVEQDEWEIYTSNLFEYNVDNTIIPEKQTSIFVTPTLASETISVVGITENAHIEIVDAFGKVILAENIDATSSVSVEELASGIYFYNVYEEYSIASGKIVKE